MFYALSKALNRVSDVLSGVAEMAWDVLSGVTKTAWDVLSGVANQCGMFCPGCQKMAWDVLSRDILSYIPTELMLSVSNKRRYIKLLYLLSLSLMHACMICFC